jgi:hypothetical protein
VRPESKYAFEPFSSAAWPELQPGAAPPSGLVEAPHGGPPRRGPQGAFSVIVPSSHSSPPKQAMSWGMCLRGTDSLLRSACAINTSGRSHCTGAMNGKWRMYFGSGNGKGQYEDAPFSPKALVGIIFGMRISDAKRAALETLIGVSYPHVAIMQAWPSPNPYQLLIEDQR